MRYDAFDDYYKSSIMNFPFGGAFNSRLNLDLREERGWTYGARSSFNGDKYTGTYTFSAGIKAVATDSALNDIVKLWKEFKNGGVTEEELAFTKSSMVQSDARKYESQMQKAGFLSRIIEYNLPSDYTKKQNDILMNMKAGDLKLYSTEKLPAIDKVNIVLVGDKAKVFEGIKNCGFEVVELDRDGNPIK
jgi:zinc protease